MKKNIPLSSNPLKKKSTDHKQTNNKTCIIKLEVNKLINPDPCKLALYKNKENYNRNSKFEYKHSPHNHYSPSKNNQNKSQKKVIKTFDELYFQKIKLLKLQQNKCIPPYQKDDRFAFQQNISPLPSKNLASIKTRNTKTVHYPHSTKNGNFEQNKQNYFVQKTEAITKYNQKSDLFKKKDSNFIQMEINVRQGVSSSLEKISQKIGISYGDKIQDQKVKKVLKLKKPIRINKDEKLPKQGNFLLEQSITSKPIDSFENKKQFGFLQNYGSNQQNTINSPINSSINPSLQLKSFKMPNSAQSGQKNPILSSFEIIFDQIIHRKINHSQHEHIWNGSECFFSFDEFQFILQQIGFRDNIAEQKALFYVNKLWKHLGGDLYGGVVRKNMRQLLNVMLQENKDLNNNNQILTSQQQLPFLTGFIDKSSLRLIQLDQKTKQQIKQFYQPFIISKINHSNTEAHKSDRLNTSINSVGFGSGKNQNQPSYQKKDSIKSTEFQPQQSCLLNYAYLDTISGRNRNEDLSPCMLPRVYDDSSDINFVSDFSPKMSVQTFEPFKSTVLKKDNLQTQKISTQQEDQGQDYKKRFGKPILSIDVNLGQGILQKLVVFQGQNPYEVSLELKERYNIDEQLRQRFQVMLRNHLNTLLFKIQEVSQELFQDSLELGDQENETDFVIMERQ